MSVNLADIEPGTNISFRSKNANDLVVWQGVLELKGTYKAVLPYTANTQSYNEAVRQSDPGVSQDFTQLNYFMITVDNQAIQPTQQIFAAEWIAPGSLQTLTVGNKVTIQVEDPFNNSQNILSLLANGGYACRIISST